MLPHGRLIGLVVTAVVSLLLLIAPVYSNGQTLIGVNGARVFGILAIPIVIALAPLVFPKLKIPAAIAMLLFALIGGFSIGFFYLPAAMVLAWPELSKTLRPSSGRDSLNLRLTNRLSCKPKNPQDPSIL